MTGDLEGLDHKLQGLVEGAVEARHVLPHPQLPSRPSHAESTVTVQTDQPSSMRGLPTMGGPDTSGAGPPI